MKVSVQYAAEHFEDLVSAAYSGEPVEIASAGRPALRLVPSAAPAQTPRAGKRILGAGTAFHPLPSPEQLEDIDFEWKREIEAKVLGPHAE